MNSLATFSLALMLASPTAAHAQDADADASTHGSANGVGTTNEGTADRVQSTSPKASAEGQAGASEHTGIAVGATEKARADNRAPAASGAGEATVVRHGKAKPAAKPDTEANGARSGRDATAEAADEAAAWPGKGVDSSEIT
jgi:hypothetical protein